MLEKKIKREKVFAAIQTDESIDRHIRAWWVQPVAWAFIALVIVIGNDALGVFWNGLAQ
jgi:hypothetical protein